MLISFGLRIGFIVGCLVLAAHRIFVDLSAMSILRALVPVVAATLLIQSFRRSSQIRDGRISSQAIVAGHILSPLMVSAGAEPSIPVPFLGAVVILGVTIVLLGYLDLGRSFALIPQKGTIKTHGLYQFVRHPTYLGYSMTVLVLLAAYPNLWNLAATMAFFLFGHLRMNLEERVLIAGSQEEYFRYASSVRYR